MQNFDLPIYETLKKITRPTRHASCEETKISDYTKTTTFTEDWREQSYLYLEVSLLVVQGIKSKIKRKIIKLLDVQDATESSPQSFYRENCLTNLLRLI